MQAQAGVFIVLEGSDGSGKGTQLRLLEQRLKAVGYDVEVFDFPRYDQPSSHFVKRYLNGEYGPASQISPYTASLFFAIDRFEAAPAIRKALAADKVVLANRYVGSNMAHQGSKFTNSAEQRGFFLWADSLEYGLLGVPRPTINLYLRVPADVSFELIKQKAARSYTSRTHDEHEADIEYLRKSVATYDLLSQLFPKDFKVIEGSSGSELLSVPEVNNKIWETIKPLLPPKPQKSGQEMVVKLDQLLVEPPTAVMTTEDELKPEIRIAKNSSDSASFVIGNVSMLIANSVYGLAGVDFELRPKDGSSVSFDYYSMPRLPVKLSQKYKNGMEGLQKIVTQMEKELRKHLMTHRSNLTKKELGSLVAQALKPLIPLAALGELKFSGIATELERLSRRLLMKKSNEAQWLAKQLLKVAAQHFPKESIATSQPAVEGQPGQVLASLAQIPPAPAGDISADVQLLSAWPRNEFELLSDIIYPYTDLARNQITAEVETWPYEKKLTTLQASLASEGPAILEQMEYRWDILADQIMLEKLNNVCRLRDLKPQTPSVRFGFDMPEAVEQAGLEDAYHEAFDLSLSLYSQFQAEGKEDLAAYVTLLGHKNRWEITTPASSLSIRAQSSGLNEFLAQMEEEISQVHPVVAESLFRDNTHPDKKVEPAKEPTKKSSKRAPAKKRTKGGSR